MESTRLAGKHAWWYYICIENNLASQANVRLISRSVERPRVS